MANGLLASLRKYPSKEKNNPLENFITESFAWLLKNEDDFSSFFIKKISEKLNITMIGSEKGSWATQENFNNNFPDMVCYLGNNVIVFENKAWSELSDNQLKKYKDYAASNFENSWIILITATRKQHKQNADLSLCWNEIHQYISEWIIGKENISFIFNDFLELLEIEGMGPPAPISHEGLKYYYSSLNLTNNITALMQANKEREWSKYFNNEKSEPWFHSSWGRVGMNFLTWHPAIFIGIMLDGRDHCTTPIDIHKGPDACLIISFDKKLHKDYPTNEHYKNLTKILSDKIERLNNGWQFYNHLEDDSARRKNRWHPIHIRRPLLDVLAGTKSTKDQEDTFYNQISSILDIITSIDSFWHLRESLLQKEL